MIHSHERYESLGTNCEFGFALRASGSTTGGFFRWAEAPAASVLKILEAGLQNQFLYDHLIPLYSSMVWDVVNNIGFHSKLHSIDKQWTQSEDERRLIHAQELDRHTQLIGRFLERARAPSTVFVLKEDIEQGPSVASGIARALRDLGAKNLFVVHKASTADSIGRVEEHQDYFIGYVDRFAPASNASDFSPVWDLILNEYDSNFPTNAYGTDVGQKHEDQ